MLATPSIGPHIVLTSNFPRPGNELIAEYLRGVAGVDAVKWTSAAPDSEIFRAARNDFESYGFRNVVEVRPAGPITADDHGSAAYYLSGGDPVSFRDVLTNSPLADWLLSPEAEGRVLFGASGGAMQFTRNVSIFRLMQRDLRTVLAEHVHYNGLGLVPFEILPHFNRHPPEFIEKVRLYSAQTGNAIWCLPDGAGVAVSGSGLEVPIGKAVRLRAGAFS